MDPTMRGSADRGGGTFHRAHLIGCGVIETRNLPPGAAFSLRGDQVAYFLLTSGWSGLHAALLPVTAVIARGLPMHACHEQALSVALGQAQAWTEEWFDGHGLHWLGGAVCYPKAV
jgi:hypothetical protein